MDSNTMAVAKDKKVNIEVTFFQTNYFKPTCQPFTAELNICGQGQRPMLTVEYQKVLHSSRL